MTRTKGDAMSSLLPRFLCLASILAVCPELPVAGQAGDHSAAMTINHGLPMVKVTIGGQGPFEFVVDTGTSEAAIVSLALAQKLKLQSTGQKHLTDLSGEADRVVDTVTLDSLSVAGLDFHGVAALVNQFPGAGRGCDGVLGIKLFRDKTLTVDFPKKRIIVGDDSLSAQDGAETLPLSMKSGIPVVTISVNGRDTEAAIDTGSSALSLPESVGKGLGFTGSLALVAKGQTQVSQYLVQGGTMIGQVGLGAYRFNGPYIEMSSIFPIAGLGTNALKDFAISIDQRSNAARFLAGKRDHHIGIPEKDDLHLPVSGDVVSQAIMSHGQL